MSNPVIRIRRRVTGAAGAPAALKTGELAWNQVDNTLYGGKGDDGGGNATSVDILGGSGAFVDKFAAQTIAGTKTFQVSPGVPTPTSASDAANKAYVDAHAGSLAPGDGIAIGSGVVSVDTTVARLASPAFSGTPTAPTPANATSNTQLATTAFVHALIDAVLGTAPAALDTLQELAAALGNDANFAASVTSGLAGKQPLDATLTALAGLTTAADKVIYASGLDTFALADFTPFGRSLIAAAGAAAARSSLGLGTLATQGADNVSITGGTIDVNVSIAAPIDGGTF